MGYLEEIVREVKAEGGRKRLGEIKRRVAKKYRLSRVPANSEVLACARGDKDLVQLMRKKPVRTASGVAVVAVMARPYPCPGRCIYCPRGEGAPQSYTGREPAALRAGRLGYDPYLQVTDRLTQLYNVGHPVEKAELIVMGGTFLAQPEEYQEEFVRRCLEAMNAFASVEKTGTMAEAQVLNEGARARNVGMTFETRPDYSSPAHVDRMLAMGATRVELGVQTLSDQVYARVERGHTVEDVVRATRVIKDAGLKVGYHMMPGLFSSPGEDLATFRRLFEEDGFRPDMLKIYPTLVLKGTGLYDLWEQGLFEPYGDEEALELVAQVKRLMPPWVRTMRIQRDIPSDLIEAGVRKGDLGDLVARRMRERGWRCRCIRCREVGHRGLKLDPGKVELSEEVYSASGGTEHFLSFADPGSDTLVAYLRLRFPSEEAHRREVQRAALVRELRVLGQTVPIGEREEGAEQHRGWGKALLERAEEVASAEGRERLLILSAIGTRPYYRRLGYRRVGPYVGKEL
ncbi:MAG: tRNA uridine(34) 5-carboxymethylaminomethyl modification radical SAM/GNAT enzyme Elp3 [Euryarchaeota archaeon]|nr:tRNA uridine(34) 5-carboxymethylaminomethyl modification radical SAM/GNAT enzyme Elp3 [Euryarchaeota archaeon]